MAKIIMAPNPTTLVVVPSVYQCYEALKTGHNSFPIVNRSGQLIGQISANFLIVLIQKRQWYSRSLNHQSVTMINNFDYGPQYNEQILLESTVMLNRMDSIANDKPSTIV